MSNITKSYLINIGQSMIASDKKARIHKLISLQPARCQLKKIKSYCVVKSKRQAIHICNRLGIDYKFCDYCC